MKKKYYILASLLVCFIGMTSCVGDLDVQPLDSTVVTAERAYSDAESYTKGLNKIYSVWAHSGQNGGDSDIQGLDGGETVLLRCWWTMQEQTTDECKNASTGAWINEINELTWSTAKNQVIEGVYQRCMFVVALANEFMKNVDNAPAEIDKKSYAAQARFNRALAYYVLMDSFGRPPFITEQNYSLNPSQLSRAELFNWIESELTTIRTDLPATRSEYGRADQTVVDALLARMYLNAEVYTGQPRYTDCITACKRVIPNYSLAQNYADLFKADNGENPETLKEIIFPIMFDGRKIQSWAMTAIIVGSRKEAGGGVREGWSVFRSTQNLVKLFDFKDNTTPKPAEIKDKRGIFDDYNGVCNYEITTGVTGTFATEGWGVQKYTNLTSTGEAGQDVLWVYTFPEYIRKTKPVNFLAIWEATGKHHRRKQISLLNRKPANPPTNAHFRNMPESHSYPRHQISWMIHPRYNTLTLLNTPQSELVKNSATTARIYPPRSSPAVRPAFPYSGSNHQTYKSDYVP